MSHPLSLVERESLARLVQKHMELNPHDDFSQYLRLLLKGELRKEDFLSALNVVSARAAQAQSHKVWEPMCDAGHLRKFFDAVPDRLKPRADVPFPPDLVNGITEDQIASLQALFDIHDDDRYYEWAHDYKWINWRYLERGEEGCKQAATVARELRACTPAESMPEVFFCLVFSLQLDERRANVVDEKRGGRWTLINERAQENARQTLRAIHELRRAIGPAAQGDGEGWSGRCLPRVDNWCREKGLEEQLRSLAAVVKEDRDAAQSNFCRQYARDKKYNPSGKKGAQSLWVYAAADRVAELLRREGRTNRDVAGATGLFRRFGIVIDEQGLKNARMRRDREGSEG